MTRKIMSDYYTPQKTRGLYDPKGKEPFKISRSGIELFMNCPFCFYMDKRLGVRQPPGYPFALNAAVDALLKKEFDRYRKLGKPHPLMKKYKINAVPFKHKDLDDWRNNFKGVQVLHKKTNLLIFGAVDDVWSKPDGTLIVADYKATAKAEEIKALDKDWQISYKRQSEIYEWLLRGNGFKVSDTAYFVYADGDTDCDSFGDTLHFDTRLIPYTGDDSWVEGVILKIKKILDSAKPPKSGADCDFCNYREAVSKTI